MHWGYMATEGVGLRKAGCFVNVTGAELGPSCVQVTIRPVSAQTRGAWVGLLSSQPRRVTRASQSDPTLLPVRALPSGSLFFPIKGAQSEPLQRIMVNIE